jgi:hypothetical protein
MGLGEAEKQRRYRERHVGADGDKVRIDLYVARECVSILRHMARHHQCSVTRLVENLARDAERWLKYEQMTRAQRKAYERSSSDLDFLERGWRRRIRAKEGAPPRRKKLMKVVSR